MYKPHTTPDASDLLPDDPPLAATVERLSEEKALLEQRVASLETRLYKYEQTHASLLEQIEQMEIRHREITERYLEVEQMSANFANLYVASSRIHGSLERDEVLTALQEILINLVGTEEFAILERVGGTAALRVATSFGLEDARLTDLTRSEGVGAAIAHGTPDLATMTATGTTPPITVCIPLRVGESVVGAIVVYRLLAHKPTLEDADRELLDLLATQGASALYCSSLASRARAEARA